MTIDKVLEVAREVIENESIPKPGAKKRGRKPKGGKIIQQTIHLNNNKDWMQRNSLLLIKGSRGMALEKILQEVVF